jgi:hypothetical protein
MITAMGMAKITPLIPIVTPHKIIQMKMSTGLTPRFCLNNNGISTLFSSHCTQNTTAIPMIIPIPPLEIPAMITTGIPPSVGQIYGINSVKAEITANDHLLGISIPNKARIHKIAYIVIPI